MKEKYIICKFIFLQKVYERIKYNKTKTILTDKKSHPAVTLFMLGDYYFKSVSNNKLLNL